MDDLDLRQEELQKEAKLVLEDLQLVQQLSKIGESKIIGSVALGLMTWKDIDIHCWVKEQSIKKVSDVAFSLIKNRNIKGVHIQDNTDFRVHKHHPDGIYLGVNYPINGAWKIDIWFMEPSNDKDVTYTEWLQSNLTAETKKIILEIKDKMASHPKYRKSIFSTDIYDAVLKGNAKTLDDFTNYILKQGKSL